MRWEYVGSRNDEHDREMERGHERERRSRREESGATDEGR